MKADRVFHMKSSFLNTFNMGFAKMQIDAIYSTNAGGTVGHEKALLH